MAGAVQVWKKTRDTGVKPVIGCEVYIANDRHAHEKGNAHLTLLAADNEGYGNLISSSPASALWVGLAGYVPSPNGLPSESRQIDQCSPGCTTSPPSSTTRFSATVMSGTRK